jgi:hypothetical protein
MMSASKSAAGGKRFRHHDTRQRAKCTAQSGGVVGVATGIRYPDDCSVRGARYSFAPHILGNALLRYPYPLPQGPALRLYLPTTLPWDALIERGQVQAVRNECGTDDMWTKLVD